MTQNQAYETDFGEILSPPMVTPGEPTETEETRGHQSDEHKDGMIYGVEDRPPLLYIVLTGIQHFTLSFTGLVIYPILVSGSLCFDRDLLNQLIAICFVVSGVATFLQTFLGIRLPIIQGASFAYYIPTVVLLGTKGDCPSITANSTMSEREELRDVALGRMRELQGAILLASVCQCLLGFTGLIGVLLRFIRPITVAVVLILLGISLVPLGIENSKTHWGVSSACMVLVIIFTQFLDKYSIPLPGGRRFALFTYFPLILATGIMWIVCWILTATGVLPEEPEHGYQARTDLYTDTINDAAWFRIPYPGQFGLPIFGVAGFVGMLSGVLASIVESLGDYHACALITGQPPPPTEAINRGIGMEGVAGVISGFWGGPSGVTSYSNNISILALTKIASRECLYFTSLLFILCGVFFKFSAFWSALPPPVIGGIICTTIGMVASVGFANLSHIQVDTSRNLFILGFSLVMGIGIPMFLTANPDAINTGSDLLDQILAVVLGTGMFLGGVTACLLDNIITGTPEEKGTDWRNKLDGGSSTNQEDKTRPTCYDLPLGMKLTEKLGWTSYIPFCPK